TGDGVGELDFPARAGLYALEEVEDARGEDIPSDDCQGRGRELRRRLLDDAARLGHPAGERLGLDDTVLVGFTPLDFLDAEQAAAVVGEDAAHLADAAMLAIVDQVVGE